MQWLQWTGFPLSDFLTDLENQLNLSKLLEVFWYYTIVLDWEVAENVYPSVETKKLSPIINITLWFLGEENCPQV